ncbi:MAG: pyridoxamine 5'-phosphate oxidase [Cytophagales bacterium]|nr:pyridoxamine 5'-phosphate oxidase [Cytophagales bacterium]
MDLDLSSERVDYTKNMEDLSTSYLPNPVDMYKKWYAQAAEIGESEPNAMVLSTVDVHMQPHSRVVLLKGIEDGKFRFFTNYHSHKAMQINDTTKVCLLFFWQKAERQVRIEGVAHKVSNSQSDDYFADRPRGSQLAAHASPQSNKIESREWLENNYKSVEIKFKGVEVPRPGHWGGYEVVPSYFEFWQGKPSRLHERRYYTLNDNGLWHTGLLAP